VEELRQGKREGGREGLYGLCCVCVRVCVCVWQIFYYIYVGSLETLQSGGPTLIFLWPALK